MVSHLSKMKLAFIILVAATALVFGYVAYAVSEHESEDPLAEGGLFYRANVLTTPPHSYWNLTDPDRYVLEAIENPGVWVKANQTDTTFHDQVILHGWSATVLYNGQYYKINCLFVDTKGGPSGTLIGPAIVGVSVSWIAFGTVAVLKRRKPASR